MKRKYNVFVSYSVQTEQGNIGFGNTTQFYTNRKYISPKEIIEMQDEIKKQKGYKVVVIMNYQFM